MGMAPGTVSQDGQVAATRCVLCLGWKDHADGKDNSEEKSHFKNQ